MTVSPSQPWANGAFVAKGKSGQFLYVDINRELVVAKTAACAAGNDCPKERNFYEMIRQLNTILNTILDSPE